MDKSRLNTKVITDQELILRIQQGDGVSFAQFYERHRSSLYFSAYHLLRDEDDANDAVQELFSEMWQHADRIDPTRNIKGYLYTILRNKILTAINRSKHFDEYVNSYLAFENQTTSVTEETVLVRELEHILEEKISQLPPKMREVYELSWRENLTNQEIATKMNITEGTVKQHKHQALRILRGKLQRIVSFIFL